MLPGIVGMVVFVLAGCGDRPAAKEVAIEPTTDREMVSADVLWVIGNMQLPRTVDGGRIASGEGAMGDAPGGVSPVSVPQPPALITAPSERPLAADWRSFIRQYTDWDWATAERIVMCESGGDFSAIGGDNLGGFQINVIHAAKAGGGSLLDMETNVRVAHQIWADQGWAPWACRP